MTHFFRKKLILALFIILLLTYLPPHTLTADAQVVKVLSNTNHFSTYIGNTITQLLGAGHLDVDIIVHRTSLSDAGLNRDASNALNTTNSNYELSNSNVVNAAPYQLYTTSFTGYAGDTVSIYNQFDGVDLLHNFAFTSRTEGPPPAFHSAPGGTAFGSNPGVEWTIPVNNEITFSENPSTLSEVTARNAGLLTAIRHDHPTWNWFDVKAALRQTASNWSTGYNSASYGFGNVFYAPATALTDNDLLLQPPVAIAATNSISQITFTLYPYKQTRRVKEVLFQFPSNPGFQGNELSLSDITSLGGTKLTQYIDTRATSTLTPTYNQFTNAHFVWFTADNSDDALANFSRIDTYSNLGPFSQPEISFSTPLNLNTPTANFITTSTLPVFTWNAPISHLGISKYQLYIDGVLTVDNILGTTTPLVTPLSIGVHTWNVIAFNGGGATTSSPVYSFRITDEEPYYVDNVLGNDSNNGTQALPWATIGRAVSVAEPSDTIIIIKNDSQPYRESIAPDPGNVLNGNITLRGVDAQNKPEIWGSLNVSQAVVLDWTTVPGALPNTYQRTMSGVGVLAAGANINALSKKVRGGADELTLSEGEWTTDGTILYYRLSANENISTLHLEAGQQSNGLVCTSRNTFKDLVIRYVNTTAVSLGTSCIGEGLEVYDNGAIGVAMSDNGAGTSQGAILRYSSISGNTTQGINLQSITYGRVYNNVVSNNATGIYMGNYAHYSLIRNNIFSHNTTNIDVGFTTALISFAASNNNWYLGTVDSDWTNTYQGTRNIASTSPLLVNYQQKDFRLDSLSPNIDTGLTVGLNTDVLGNPIYGTPDIGAVEYQPPFTIGVDGINTSGNVKLYGNGKYRYLNATSTSEQANLSVAPQSGFGSQDYADYMVLDINTWGPDEVGSTKSWTASSSNAGLAVFSIEGLTPSTNYNVAVDGLMSGRITGSNCVSHVCTTNSSGLLTFTYSGGWSTHTFSVERSLTQVQASSGGGGGGGGSKKKKTDKVEVPKTTTSSTTTASSDESTVRKNLLVKIEELRNILKALLEKHSTSTTVTTSTFTRPLSAGDTNNDVLLLQRKLNALGFTIATSGIGSPGNETGYFGSLTTVALQKFQCQYKIVCRDYVDTRGYGVFGPATMAKINEL